MEDQFSSLKDSVTDKLRGYFRPSQEGNQQQRFNPEDETRLILFIYVCFNFLMFTMVSIKIFVYWIAVNILVFFGLKYVMAEQKSNGAFEGPSGHPMRIPTFFEGGYNQDIRVPEIKPKVKPQDTDKKSKESYVLTESKGSIKKRSIYASAEPDYPQISVKEIKAKPSASPIQDKKEHSIPEQVQKEQKPDDSVDEKKSTLVQKPNQLSSLSVSLKKAFSFDRFATFFKRRAPTKVEKIEMEEEIPIKKEKEQNKMECEIPKEKEEQIKQPVTQEEVVAQKNQTRKDFQNEMIQELMKQMGGKDLAQLLLQSKQKQQHQQPKTNEINNILDEMENDSFNNPIEKEKSHNNVFNKSNPIVSPVVTLTKPVHKETTKQTTLTNPVPNKIQNNEQVEEEQPQRKRVNIMKKTETKIEPSKPSSVQETQNISEVPRSKPKTRLAYIDDDSEEDEPVVATQNETQKNLNQTQPEVQNYQSSFTLNGQNPNESEDQPQDINGYESVSFGGFGEPNLGKSKYFACVFSGNPEREDETEAKPENEVQENNKFGFPGSNIEFPGTTTQQDWNIEGGLNQASFFNNFGGYFNPSNNSESWNNNEQNQQSNYDQQEQNNNTVEITEQDHVRNQGFEANPPAYGAVEENNSMYQNSYTDISQQNINPDSEEQDFSIMSLKSNTNKPSGTGTGTGSALRPQKKGFLGRRGLSTAAPAGKIQIDYKKMQTDF